MTKVFIYLSFTAIHKLFFQLCMGPLKWLYFGLDVILNNFSSFEIIHIDRNRGGETKPCI